MAKDFSKLQKFVEAALTNPAHPVYKMGMTHSPILQHYAVNVRLLQGMSGEQWFADYPEKTARLEEVMKLCEEDTPAPQKVDMTDPDIERIKREAEIDAITQLRSDFEELKKQMSAKPAEKPEEKPEEKDEGAT